MTLAFSARTSSAFVALALLSAGVARAQAPVTPPSAPVAVAPPPLPPAPELAPPPETHRPLPRAASAVANQSAPGALRARASAPRPDSLMSAARAPIALVTPTPLVRIAPGPLRVRDLGVVRNDVARQPAPAGATGRCKDGTFLTSPASEEACAGKGGLSSRMPLPPAAPTRP